MQGVSLDQLPMADIVAYLELNPPSLPYASLVNVPQATKAYTQVRDAAGMGGNSTFQLVVFDTVDVDSINATGAGLNRLTLLSAGFYLVFFTATGAGMTGSGNTIAELIRKNNAGVVQETVVGAATNTLNGVSVVNTGFNAKAGDYIEAYVDQGATGASGTFTSRLVLLKLS